MEVCFLVSLIAIALSIGPCSSAKFDPPDLIPVNYSYSLRNNNKELVEAAGYNYDYHKVTTEDGYIVGLHRISNPNSITHGHPVLMFNGVGVSSRCWIVRGKGVDLPFLLVDAGYDVWLGDQRSNPSSRGHVKYSLSNKAYWNFTFHESGVYDLPAMIDYILKETSQPKLSFVGQSLGSTFFFVMMSERNDYGDKIASTVHLVPLISPPQLGNMQTYVKSAIKFGSNVLTLFEGKILEPTIDPVFDFTQWLIKASCDPSPLQSLCMYTLKYTLGGDSFKNYDKEHLGFQIASSIGRTSFKTLRHIIQLFVRGALTKYDYGAVKNKIIYGTAVAPKYNITRLTSPTAIFYGKKDTLVTYGPLTKAISSMGKYVRPYLNPDFSHFDLAFGRAAPKQAYTKILDFFDQIVANELNKTKTS